MKLKKYKSFINDNQGYNEALKPSQFREYVKDFDKDKYSDIFFKYKEK